jgi:GTP cyclohydrolase IA
MTMSDEMTPEQKNKKDLLNKIVQTPMDHERYCSTTSEEKKVIIEKHFKEIMLTLGLDMTDDSLMDTPRRVAKMYVDEIYYGLDFYNFPKITCVENKFGSQMVTEANITARSSCEHHFVTIVGYAHISYIPKDKVIGLSKMNRIVDYFGARPQVQERWTEQVQQCLKELLGTEDVAVVIDGVHFCVRSRGIKDSSSITRTAALGGCYESDPTVRSEFFNTIPKIGDFKL